MEWKTRIEISHRFLYLLFLVPTEFPFGLQVTENSVMLTFRVVKLRRTCAEGKVSYRVCIFGKKMYILQNTRSQ